MKGFFQTSIGAETGTSPMCKHACCRIRKMKGFINNIFDAISDNLISGGAYYQIAKALLVTVIITLMAWVIAGIVGICISYLMSYEKKVISRIGRAICFIFRSVPVLLSVWLFYYCFFGSTSISGVIIAGISIGLFGAGHLAELISESVKKTQERMHGSLKGKLKKVYFRLVVWQALEDSLFHVKRLAVMLMQWTTVAGYISVNDLTEVMYGIGHRTMYPFFSIAFAIIIYLLATVIIEAIFKLIGKKIKKRNDEKEA